jgi:hypothetical protein
MYPPTHHSPELYEPPFPAVVDDNPQVIARRPSLLARIVDALRVAPRNESEAPRPRVGAPGTDCVMSAGVPRSRV